MRREILDRLLAAKRARIPAGLVTDLSTGLQTLVTADSATGGFGLEEWALDEVRHRIAEDAGGTIRRPDDDDDDEIERSSRLFVAVHNPPPRLLVVGAVHIAQALAPMAATTGYDVTVIDPRGAFATPARFPGVTVRDDWPDTALAALGIDTRTAVVTLAHDPKLDDPALIAALRSPAFYVGSLGSTRTHAKRLERLREAGLGEAELARIHAPVGLAIGAVGPAEIALSIMAQVTAVRRRERGLDRGRAGR